MPVSRTNVHRSITQYGRSRSRQMIDELFDDGEAALLGQLAQIQVVGEDLPARMKNGTPFQRQELTSSSKAAKVSVCEGTPALSLTYVEQSDCF